MCDTLCVVREDGVLFAKNSDRQPTEVQLIEAHPARRPGGRLRTTHIEIEDAGAYAIVGGRPDWMWGMEHGVNEHRVAIGNEKVWTTLDPAGEPAGLTGMDLVRLGLERSRTADEALEVITGLIERYGQGGMCDPVTREAYFSSFLIADPRGGWVLETSGRTWVAAPVAGSAAISNRLTLGTEWRRSSPDVPPGADWDAWRNPRAPTGHADARLAASKACVARGPALTPAALAAHLRDHGSGPWGEPGGDPAVHPPAFPVPDGTNATVCMHFPGFQNTTGAMICELPADPARPLRAWLAPGQPCVSVFVPVFPPHAVPEGLADPETWHGFAKLRDKVEANPALLARVRAVTAPLEDELWAEADAVAPYPERHASFTDRIRTRRFERRTEG